MSFKNKKIAFVFPGQGSQYVGMGIDFVNMNPKYNRLFDDFRIRTGVDLLSIMRDGPEERLKETRYTQPAILSHSIMALQTFLSQYVIKPDFVAGHSLGEFSALVSNGVLDPLDAMYLVHRRGEFMIKANEGTPFAMAAILGLDVNTVKSICEEISNRHLVVAANFNTPIQTVISGTKEGVELASELAKEKNAKRVLPLVVGGPFHSPLISKASKWLSEEMKTIFFQDADVPVICNVNALPEKNSDKIIENLTNQVTSAVLWVDSINYLAKEGVEIYIEFGPQKVLSGMINKIQENAMVHSVDKYDDIKHVIEQLESL
jgi:[acyl-carrier-protein] S-malonyltransferase